MTTSLFCIRNTILSTLSNQVSDTTFKRYRPKNVLPVMFNKRRACLCKIHPNFHLRLAPLKPFGVPQSATNFLELYQTKESLESELAKLPNEDVQFRMWKQTTQMHKGKSVKRTTLFDEVESKEVFHKNFLDYFDIFKAHHDRVITQYKQFLILKRQLTQVEATCQIDFAENYVCSFSQEITRLLLEGSSDDSSCGFPFQGS